MNQFSETVDISPTDDGFVSVSVHRRYDSGISYRSVLFFQPGDSAQIADAFDRFVADRTEQSVDLADGRLRLFGQEPGIMLNIELHRDQNLAHGGYDTMDLAPDSVATVSKGLRTYAR